MKTPIKILLLFIGSIFLFSQCSDDLKPSIGNGSDDISPNSVTVKIPVPEIAPSSRASYSITEDEGKINDLHIIFYNEADNSRPAFLHTWTQDELAGLEVDENGFLTSKVINLEPGVTYSIYVVANIAGQTFTDESSFSTSVSEADLNTKILNWETLPVGNNLPMVFTTSGIEATEGLVITANMTIAAVKVRYNVIFDSRIFGDQPTGNVSGMPAGLEITGVTFSKTADKASMIKNENTTYTRSGDVPGEGTHYSVDGVDVDKYYNPDNINGNIATDRVMTGNLTEKEDDWISAWVYQGTIYLPERYSVSESDAPTKMTISGKLYDESGTYLSDTEYIVENIANTTGDGSKSTPRGRYYEVTGKISTPGNSLLAEVTVKPWTALDLYYSLHDTLELVVEKTQSVAVSSGKWTILGFRSDVPDDQIRFPEEMMPIIETDNGKFPFYYAEVITSEMEDENGKKYTFEDEWPSHLRVMVNPDIPYYILKEVVIEGLVDGEYVQGETKYKYNGEIVDYFHISAGNLHKRIAVGPLERDPILNLSPKLISINMQDKLASATYTDSEFITFHTNLNLNENVTFTLTMTDEEGNSVDLIAGVGPSALQSDVFALQIIRNEEEIEKGDGNVYNVKVKNGTLQLDLMELLDGNPLWQQEKTYTLTLKINSPGVIEAPLEESMQIEIKPYNTDYVIHFKDNTKTWEMPHIYIYQLLTMPIDLLEDKDDPSKGLSVKAGKTVGYKDSGGNFQGGIQYQFTNNVSFRGWKGYGGPDSYYVDPYYISTYSITTDVTAADYTMGFVVFGEKPAPDGDGVVRSWGNWFNPWGVHEGRFIVYNYEGNLNTEHEKNKSGWVCATCRDCNSDYNGAGNDRSWPGIVMEKESDGWWKYTLTGVAMPGRTMIMFSEGHENHNGGKYLDREDKRWPADSQVGVPLFDYSDKEGWFLFNGNTTDHNQSFSDEEPDMFNAGGDQYPSTFTAAMMNNMQIRVEKPKSRKFTEMVIQNASHNVKIENMTETDLYYSYDFTEADFTTNKITGWNAIDIGVFINGEAYTSIKLRPVNFVYESGKYVATVKLEFKGGEKLYLKWRDWDPSQIKNKLKIFWDTPGSWTEIGLYLGEKSGNYRCLEYTVPYNMPDNANPRYLHAQPFIGNEYYGVNEDIDIYDIQQNFYPADGRWHVIMNKEK